MLRHIIEGRADTENTDLLCGKYRILLTHSESAGLAEEFRGQAKVSKGQVGYSGDGQLLQLSLSSAADNRSRPADFHCVT